MYINIASRTTKFIKEILHRMKEHDVSGMAAQLSFFFLLSLFPLLLVLVTLLPYLPLTTIDVLSFLDNFVPEESMQLIEKQVNSLMVQNVKLLSVGIIGTLWSASNGMNALVKAFNHAYEIMESRTFLLRRVFAIILTFGMIFVFIVALLLPVFGQQITNFIISTVGYGEELVHLFSTLRWVTSGLITFIMFLVLYWIFPNIKLRGRNIFRGALFATIGMSIVSYGFSVYVNNFANYTTTYGSIGGIIVLMLWFYLCAHVIILGGEIVAMSYTKQDEE